MPQNLRPKLALLHKCDRPLPSAQTYYAGLTNLKDVLTLNCSRNFQLSVSIWYIFLLHILSRYQTGNSLMSNKLLSCTVKVAAAINAPTDIERGTRFPLSVEIAHEFELDDPIYCSPRLFILPRWSIKALCYQIRCSTYTNIRSLQYLLDWHAPYLSLHQTMHSAQQNQRHPWMTASYSWSL